MSSVYILHADFTLFSRWSDVDSRIVWISLKHTQQLFSVVECFQFQEHISIYLSYILKFIWWCCHIYKMIVLFLVFNHYLQSISSDMPVSLNDNVVGAIYDWSCTMFILFSACNTYIFSIEYTFQSHHVNLCILSV